MASQKPAKVTIETSDGIVYTCDALAFKLEVSNPEPEFSGTLMDFSKASIGHWTMTLIGSSIIEMSKQTDNLSIEMGQLAEITRGLEDLKDLEELGHVSRVSGWKRF